jgi:hypothetical protein
LNEEDPDAELLARIDGREPGAVREMVTRKLPRLLALATRMLGDRDEASDVAQEVLYGSGSRPHAGSAARLASTRGCIAWRSIYAMTACVAVRK